MGVSTWELRTTNSFKSFFYPVPLVSAIVAATGVLIRQSHRWCHAAKEAHAIAHEPARMVHLAHGFLWEHAISRRDCVPAWFCTQIVLFSCNVRSSPCFLLHCPYRHGGNL